MHFVSQDSLQMIGNAYADSSVNTAKVYDRFQFERQGFFSVDPDSSPSKVEFIFYSDVNEQKYSEIVSLLHFSLTLYHKVRYCNQLSVCCPSITQSVNFFVLHATPLKLLKV